MAKYLGIEIGGTKLQLGVGTGATSKLDEVVRTTVDVEAGANGIVQAIETHGRELLNRHRVTAVGIGFGGPVNTRTGVATKSHQIAGWDNFPLGKRLSDCFERSVFVDNDCNVAALGEAKLGAGQGSDRVFYVTVGTGIGGGFVVGGKLDGSGRPAISEIGHLRPGLAASCKDQTVEQLASGWGIEATARGKLRSAGENGQKERSPRRLLELCAGDPMTLSSKQVGVAVQEGDPLANAILDGATQVLGWAIAQTITLLSPNIIVIGGGVSLIGDAFFDRVRKYVGTYVFPPLADSFSIMSASLGEEVVVHGAIQLALDRDREQ